MVARHVVAPTGIVTTSWPKVRDTCGRLGWGFDGWQDGAGKLILSKRADGSYAADTIVISIPRQVGKTYLIACIIFALCLLEPGLKVIWTAHRKSTSAETFRQFDGMARRPKVAPHVRQVLRGKGDESIWFINGSTIEFGARESGFGRGRTDVDVLVFDEGQILPESTLEDMGATQNVAKNPLTFVMGTPPRPKDDGEFFTLLRQEALDGESDGTLYIETSADRGVDVMDRGQWRKANPSFPIRTTERAMLRLRKKLKSDDSWKREALGIWDEIKKTQQVIAGGDWLRLVIPDEQVPQVKPTRYALTMSPNRVGVIAVGIPEGTTAFLDLAELDRVDDSRKIIDWFVERKSARMTVMIDSRDPAASLVNELRTAGVKVNTTGQGDAAKACMGFVTAVDEMRIWHVGQEVIQSGLKVAQKKLVGRAGLWEWDLDDPSPEVAAVRAITLAHYGLTFEKKRTGEGRRSSPNRKAVVR